MAISEAFKDYAVDQLEAFGIVSVKKMFGGAGLYHDGLIFALIADDVLYFKVDDSNKADYKKAGMKPFKPFADKPMVMPYYEVPADVLEDRNRLAEWAEKACAASKNGVSKSKKR